MKQSTKNQKQFKMIKNMKKFTLNVLEVQFQSEVHLLLTGKYSVVP